MKTYLIVENGSASKSSEQGRQPREEFGNPSEEVEASVATGAFLAVDASVAGVAAVHGVVVVRRVGGVPIRVIGSIGATTTVGGVRSVVIEESLFSIGLEESSGGVVERAEVSGVWEVTGIYCTALGLGVVNWL